MQLFPSRDSKGEISAPPKEYARARARAPCCHLPSNFPCSPCLSSLPAPAAPSGRHQSFSHTHLKSGPENHAVDKFFEGKIPEIDRQTDQTESCTSDVGLDPKTETIVGSQIFHPKRRFEFGRGRMSWFGPSVDLSSAMTVRICCIIR
jgi:hypothetical protein